MAVRQSGGAGADRVDHVKLRTVAAGFDDERPQMHVGAVNVRGPDDDELRMAELFGLGSILQAERGYQGGAAGGGADGPVQPRRAQAMEETAVHAGAVQHPHGTGVAVRENRFGTEFAGNSREPFGDRVESFVPGDAGEPAFAFCADTLLGIEQAVWRILAFEVFRDFTAEETTGYRMIGIAAQA